MSPLLVLLAAALLDTVVGDNVLDNSHVIFKQQPLEEDDFTFQYFVGKCDGVIQGDSKSNMLLRRAALKQPFSPGSIAKAYLDVGPPADKDTYINCIVLEQPVYDQKAGDFFITKGGVGQSTAALELQSPYNGALNWKVAVYGEQPARPYYAPSRKDWYEPSYYEPRPSYQEVMDRSDYYNEKPNYEWIYGYR